MQIIGKLENPKDKFDLLVTNWKQLKTQRKTTILDPFGMGLGLGSRKGSKDI